MREMLLRALVLVGFAALAFAAYSGQALAQGDCGECHDFQSYECQWPAVWCDKHYFGQSCDEAWCMDNPHGNIELGECHQSHGWCPPPTEEEAPELTIDTLAGAIEGGDLAQIGGLMRTHPVSLRADTDRQVIEFVSCTGALIARLPLSSEVIAHLDTLN